MVCIHAKRPEIVMVEVFKTNVTQPETATFLAAQISRLFGYRVNFDLADCDRILRVQSKGDEVHVAAVVETVKDHGFHAEVLPDVVVIR
jgi:hypothetical protein